MSDTSPLVVDETQLLLETLSVLHHELGGVAGALQMRGDALDLGAPLESGRESIRSAAEEIVRINATLQMLQALRRVPDASAPTVQVAAWYGMLAPVISSLMGRGSCVSAGAMQGALPAPRGHTIALSLMALSCAVRNHDENATGARRAIRAFTCSAQVDATRGHLSLSWTDRPPIASEWLRLAAQLADRASVQLSITPDAAAWQWSL